MVFTPIHRALGFTAGDISLELFKQATQNHVEEVADLDWKREFYSFQDKKWEEKAAKDIAAMANSGGGWIVFGVEEDGERNAASKISPVIWNSDIQQRILRVAYAKIGPPVLGLEFHPVPVDDEKSVVAMHIPDSPDAPHFARKGDDAFTAPRRNGPHTVFMSDREIERGFRERFQYVDNQEKLLQDKFREASQSLYAEKGVFIAFAALPNVPIRHRSAPTQDDIHELNYQRSIPFMFGQNVSSYLSKWKSRDISKGMRQWKIRTAAQADAQSRKSLQDDATVLAAYQLGNYMKNEKAKTSYPVGLVNHCISRDIEATVIDFVSLLRAYAENRQANGGYRIRVGLVGVENQPIYIRTREEGNHFLISEEFSEPIMSFQPVTIELDPLIPPQNLLPEVIDLTRDLINQGGVQHFEIMKNVDDHLKSK
ncbi:ATP-binding protein [Corynebacterium sp. sy017]|uniref:AlbA family DNA-binding domain-containing protein n=1 Tax=unclassified Corynebacterium TaxID=2624378 RepID=UPI00118679B2|nr:MULTISPECIES: ATP-binding protein [unclassified Corynebacterium]MBP3088490.1 ATP-binding protein [Corynebacterium sp. sy017]TSD91795.1 ATP-binding protein [Corynebacterium sp. SY003]